MRNIKPKEGCGAQAAAATQRSQTAKQQLPDQSDAVPMLPFGLTGTAYSGNEAERSSGRRWRARRGQGGPRRGLEGTNKGRTRLRLGLTAPAHLASTFLE